MLPASTRIYPALGDLGAERRGAPHLRESLLSLQRAENAALRPMSSRDFEIRILAGMKRDLIPRSSEDRSWVRPVPATEFLQAAGAGAQVLDLRSPADFAAVHLEKSINLPIVAAFEPWAKAVLDQDEPLLLIAPPGRETEAAARLLAIDAPPAAGVLKGGMQALEHRSALLRGERRVSLPRLEEELLSADPPELVEIGRPDGSTPGLQIPLEELRGELARFSPSREIVIASETSFRASAAASFLRSRGFPRVRTLAGGLAIWGRRPQLPPPRVHRNGSAGNGAPSGKSSPFPGSR